MGPCVDEEVQVFERANGAVNDDLVSLAQLEVEGTGASVRRSRQLRAGTAVTVLENRIRGSGFKSRLVIAASASTELNRAER